ncbi:MAG: hypothetical protein JW795_14390 [Chitinivibrionales bacterium]|nr:hypothetical protein [Chitinivibrionales bacterium]
MRKLISLVCLAGCFWSGFATDARILAMGRTDRFFMDDNCIFWNPANVNIYPNLLIGSLGYYFKDPNLDDTSQITALNSSNRDPQHPFFGGIISYSLNQSSDVGAQYPMISLGLLLNRYDQFLEYITPDSKKYLGSPYQGKSNAPITFEEPVGKMDLIFGYTMNNGAMIGLGTYFAYQNTENNGLQLQQTKLIKGTLGINVPIAKSVDLEFSANGGLMTKIGTVNKVRVAAVADDDIFFRSDIRLFSALSTLNGDLVPHCGVEYLRFHHDKSSCTKLDGGVAVNLNIDRGFFWTGGEIVFESNDTKYRAPLTKNDTATFVQSDLYGARMSFGIERNFFWDWLVWRLGGTKLVGFQKEGGPDGDTKWIENPEADASDDDHIAFGWSVNIENRFKIDAIMAEDIFYTFTNLLSGHSHHHIFTRFTATYSF